MKIGRLVPMLAAGIGVAVLTRMLRSDEEFDFRDKTVVITGGSRGLGLVIARELAEQGARLVLLARDGAELQRAEGELNARGVEVFALPCDVRDQEQVQAAIEQTMHRFRRIDVLINNAGVIQVGPYEHMRMEDYENAMRIHMWAPLYLMLAVIPHMRDQGGGRIVNISSIGGKVAVPHLLPYSASKHALTGLSDGIRAELAKDNIKVTTVAPGLMRTGSHLNAYFKGDNEAEFRWFALSGASPLNTMDARHAAHQIIEACRRGDPEITLTLIARVLVISNALFPNLTARIIKFSDRLLPDPVGLEGDELQTGWESESALAPSVLTQLSDKAAAENNEISADAPPVLDPAVHQDHAEMVNRTIEE